jgi:hypothetical protein
MTVYNDNDIKALSNMSIAELKQLLSCVNQDITSIKRAERRANKVTVNNAISELAECNIIAQRFTGNVVIENVVNKKIKQDIQIQQDILDYLNNGGRIITHTARGNKRKPVAPLTIALSNKVSI